MKQERVQRVSWTKEKIQEEAKDFQPEVSSQGAM